MENYNMRKFGFVYVWVNNITGNFYLGSHEGTLDDGYTGSGKVFQRAVKKYGIDNFTRCIHYKGPDFRDHEDNYLKLLDCANDPTSYNLSSNAFGGPPSETTKAKISKTKKGKKASAETKNKISKALKGKSKSQESIRKRTESRIGFRHSEETKRKIGEANIGNTPSDEARMKNSKANAGRRRSLEQRARMSAAMKGNTNGCKKKKGDL